MQIDPSKKYAATFQTSRGEIVCDLFAKDKPTTVNNFVFLAREKFYDSTTFHRVIANFMIQGGDPTATGRGGPGYQFNDEPGALAGRQRAVARLWLAAAAGTALRAGLDLLGVDAPERL